MMTGIIRPCFFVVFRCFVFPKCIFVLYELVTRLSLLGSNILAHSRFSGIFFPLSWLFVSAPQTTLRTANTCGNILPCFAPCDDRDDRPNQFLWLKLLHTSYFSPLNQVQQGRVFYSVDKHFETKRDSHNFCHKQILKMWTPCLLVFYCMFSRANFAQSFESSHQSAFFEISLRAVQKTIGSHLKSTCEPSGSLGLVQISSSCSMRRLRVFFLLPGWDASSLQGSPPPPTALSQPVPIYTPGWREAL